MEYRQKHNEMKEIKRNCKYIGYVIDFGKYKVYHMAIHYGLMK
jgi:hypothetical protein